jgi:hypothetical protein
MIALPLLLDAQPSSAKELPIWFNPLTLNVKPNGHGVEYVEHDFPSMVASDAGWRRAAGRVAVMAIPANVVASYPDLPALVAFSRRHPWKFAISFGMEFNGGMCSHPLEGMSKDSDANRGSIRAAQRWQQSGGRLDLVIMDSPLYFAHYAAADCHFSIEEAAAHAAATLRGILKEFPDVKIIDAEGPGPINTDAFWLRDMAAWFAAFRAASGRSIDMVELDLQWTDPRPGNDWQTTAGRAAQAFHAKGIATGLLINAPRRNGMTDAQWMDENREHIRQAVTSPLNLDFMEIDQWHHHVRLNLPEDDQAAYTSLIDYAFDAMHRAESSH